MKYWLSLVIPLFGCASADGLAEAGPQIVEARGESPDVCQVVVAGETTTISPTGFSGLVADREILIKAGPDTAYECVTDSLDGLNDLRFNARIDEQSWKRLQSVRAGRAKLEADIAGDSGHPEARPFVKEREAQADLDAALEKSAKSGNNVLLVMGANWCHDSRALSGWLASPRFRRLVADQYELVFIDVGYKDRNIDIAQGFGIEDIKGTPTVLVVSPEAKLLNPKSAPTWRNAASRKEDAIFDYFAKFESED